jgi:Na+-translocating ferredoxin:NAD+ oxidoreductase RnfG subunit
VRNNHLAGLMLLPVAAIVAPAYAVDYMTVEQAQKLFFPDASAFTDRKLTLDEKQRDVIKEKAGVRQRTETQAVWSAERDGKAMGWVFVDDVVGKHEFITYAAAISPRGEVMGVEILSYRETHGGQVRDAAWREKFKGKTLADPWRLGKDIPNISGATLSCRNVTDGVKRLLVMWDLVLRNTL